MVFPSEFTLLATQFKSSGARIHDDDDFQARFGNGGCGNGAPLKTPSSMSGDHAQNHSQHSPIPETPRKIRSVVTHSPLVANWKLFDELMGDPKVKECGTSPMSLEYACLGLNHDFF